MIGTISRRTFVKGIGGLFAFVMVFKHLAVDRVFGATAETVDEYPGKFLAGKVRDLTSTGFVAETVGSDKTVMYGLNTRLWKKDWTPSLPIEAGDLFYAWGDTNSDGTYTPDAIYFNIFSVYGTVASLTIGEDHATFNLSGGRQNASLVADSATLLDQGETEEPFNLQSPQFKDGDLIHVVAVRTADGLAATRILV